MLQLTKAGATEEDFSRGYFMKPFQAAYLSESLRAPKISRFIKSLAIQYSTQRLNKALYDHFTTHSIEDPLIFEIRQVSETMQLQLVLAEADADEDSD